MGVGVLAVVAFWWLLLVLEGKDPASPAVGVVLGADGVGFVFVGVEGEPGVEVLLLGAVGDVDVED